jgi:hypothetical protein
VLKHRLVAEWDDADLPPIALPPSCETPAALRGCHLVLAVWDRDHLKVDSSLGQAVLGLQPVADQLQALWQQRPADAPTLLTPPKEFALPILLHGAQHGVIRGVIQLCGPRAMPQPQPEQAPRVTAAASPDNKYPPRSRRAAAW